ncbi:hypothetical protein GCM10022268_32480 [Sphingomonas cynarae]|uniref:Uncharacterized protein n=2 Tax=Sphingomonas cynarae TaxID=930197 RepID=A0ABP7EPJ9_9SPHN
MNEFVSFEMPDGDGSGSFVIPGPNSPIFSDGEVKVTIPNSEVEKMHFSLNNKKVNPGFFMPGGDKVDRLLIELASLIAQGRLLVSPSRMVMYDSGERTNKGGVHWKALPAARNTPADAWIVSGEDRAPADTLVTDAAFRRSFNPTHAQALSDEISLPFIKGVSFSDFSKILDDESDLLIEFRQGLDTLTELSLTDKKSAQACLNETVEPKIAKINRSFNRIAGSSNIKIAGAAVATAGLALTSYLSGGMGAAILAAAGGAGAVSVLKEIAEKRDELAALKDDPLYILWRLGQAIKKP